MIGNGSFMGGVIPRHVSINGEPHQLSYINRQEAGLLSDLGGAGTPVYGVPAYFSADDADSADSGVGSFGDDGGMSADDADSADSGIGSFGPGPSGVTADDPGVAALGESFYSYDPDMSLEEAIGFTNAGQAAAAVADRPDITLEQLDPYTFQAIKNGMPYGTPVNVDPDNPAAKAIAAVMGFIDPTPFGIFSKTVKGLDYFSPPSVFAQVKGHVEMQDAMEAANEMGSGGPDPVSQRRYMPQAATPTAVVENVAAPIAAEPIFLNPTLMQRPSTLNVAPANAPADYGLLYPEQERRFQESFALRPEFYTGPLDTTGYQPVASLLI